MSALCITTAIPLSHEQLQKKTNTSDWTLDFELSRSDFLTTSSI